MVMGVDVVALSTTIHSKVRSVWFRHALRKSVYTRSRSYSSKYRVIAGVVGITVHHRREFQVTFMYYPLAQAEDGVVWREVVRDGARTGGGDSGPSPQPLFQRLSGLEPGTPEGSKSEDVDSLAQDAPLVSDPKEPEEEETGGGDLRLDEPVTDPQGPGDDSGSPGRGPPKTPKRTKASSPQPSDVSADMVVRRGNFHPL